MLPFQIRRGPQFRHFSSKMFPFQRRYGPLEKGTRTILKPAFWHFRVTFPPRFEGRRVGRVGRSAVCFFVLILNNAPALRAGKNISYGCSHARAETLVLFFFLFWVCRVGEAFAWHSMRSFQKAEGSFPVGLAGLHRRKSARIHW